MSYTCKVELLNLQIEVQFQMRLTKGTEIIYIKSKWFFMLIHGQLKLMIRIFFINRYMRNLPVNEGVYQVQGSQLELNQYLIPKTV
jgi:hypothetical protein